MTTSDPIMFPAPSGTIEAHRQDVTRSREALAATLAELGGRLDVRRAIRKRAVSMLGVVAPVLLAGSGLVVAVVAGRRQRRPLVAAGLIAAGASAGGLGYVVVRRAGRPEGSGLAGRQDRVLAMMPPAPPGGDVIDVLCEQHAAIRSRFRDVAAAPPEHVRERLASLVTMLKRHEQAEQTFVHPLLDEIDAADVRAGRLAEEHDAERAIGSLISYGIDGRHFAKRLEGLRRIVEEHAAHEEAYEFPLLRSRIDAGRLQRAANQVLSVQVGTW